MSEHTPGPWFIGQNLAFMSENYGQPAIGLDDRGGPSICVLPGGRPESECSANARFIVQACNAHDDLLEACKFLLEKCRGMDTLGGPDEEEFLQARAAIAAAEGSP